jgi:Holliday junction resolvase
MAPGNARCSPPRDRGTSIQDIDNLAAVDPTINIETQRPAQGKIGGRASRQKGNRLERAVVKLLQEHGLGAERIPWSGSAGGSYSGDLTVPILGRDLVVEAKARANGFARLYEWLENRDVLIVKADRRDALVVVRLRFAVEVAVAAERRKP